MTEIKAAVNKLIENFSWNDFMQLVTLIVKKILGFVAEEEGITTTSAN